MIIYYKMKLNFNNSQCNLRNVKYMLFVTNKLCAVGLLMEMSWFIIQTLLFT